VIEAIPLFNLSSRHSLFVNYLPRGPSVHFTPQLVHLVLINLLTPPTGMCWICHCLGAELPHPEVLARLRREKAARHNGSLNRLALRDMQLSFNRVFGIHQVG
jgi:hypothetical protein